MAPDESTEVSGDDVEEWPSSLFDLDDSMPEEGSQAGMIEGLSLTLMLPLHLKKSSPDRGGRSLCIT